MSEKKSGKIEMIELAYLSTNFERRLIDVKNQYSQC